MRETCARVLAAALMTGAIATAVGLPSAFESASAPERGLTAPPSSLQRTVRIPAGTVREPRAHRAEQLVAAHQSSRPSAVTRARNVRHVSVRSVTRRPDIAPSRGPAPKPKPTPAPAPTPTPPTAEPPVAAPQAAPTDSTRDLTSTPPSPPAAEPEAPTPPVTDEPKPDKGKGKDKEKKDKEHDRGDGHGRGNDKED
jgi:hypothetical protein